MITSFFGSMYLPKAAFTSSGASAAIRLSVSLTWAKVRPSCRLLTIWPARAASPVRPTFCASRYAFLASSSSCGSGPLARNSFSSSATAFSTRSMLTGLVVALTVKLALGSRGEADSDDVTP